jgi:hypothetical protein
MSWNAVGSAFSPRQTEGTIYALPAVTIIAVAVALARVQWGAAVLLVGAMYPGCGTRASARYLDVGLQLWPAGSYPEN